MSSSYSGEEETSGFVKWGERGGAAAVNDNDNDKVRLRERVDREAVANDREREKRGVKRPEGPCRQKTAGVG